MLSLVAKSALAWQVFAGNPGAVDAVGRFRPSQPARGGRPSRRPLHDDLPSRPAGDPAGPQDRRHVVGRSCRSRAGDDNARPWSPPRGDSHPRVSIWQERLQARMLGGDVAGSWQVIEAAMASGFEPGEIYVRVLAPSLHAIGASWRSGRRLHRPGASREQCGRDADRTAGPPVRAPGPQEGRRHRRDAARRASRTRGRDARRHP